MQTKKENIHRSVLSAAREEFLEKGYKDASMRSIAGKAGVGLGNIYNYFKDKDEIFQQVLAPVMAALLKITKEHNSDSKLNISIFGSQEYIKETTRTFVELILEFKDELRMLLFQSHGSSLEDFREQYINTNTETGLEYLRQMKQRYPHMNIDISDFFVHTMSSWWISILGELVMHDLAQDELERFLSEYIEYGTGGWKSLLHV